MRAIVFAEPGSWSLEEVPDPVPGPREVLVRVEAVGLCGTDIHVMDGEFAPTRYPIIPVFLLLRTFGLLDNLWALGLLYLGINLPLAVWMMRSFFAEVPIAVVEAAQIDGASYSRELWRVSLPIVAPGAAAAALICFIFAWNEYFLANLLTAVVARTTPPFLGSFVDGRGQFLAILSAASTIAVLPVIVAGWLAQKRLVRGLAMGAVK